MSSSGGADGASVLPKVGGGALKWLQKAGDLLDKLDKTAADTIAADDDDEEVARILGMDEEAEEGGWEEHEEGGDREGASHSSEGVRGEPQPAGRASKDSSERYLSLPDDPDVYALWDEMGKTTSTTHNLATETWVFFSASRHNNTLSRKGFFYSCAVMQVTRGVFRPVYWTSSWCGGDGISPVSCTESQDQKTV